MANSKKAIIIDDDQSIKTLIVKILESIGFEVFATSKILDGCKLVSEHSPEVVFSDLNLDGESGVGFIESIASDRPELPIIAISGANNVELTIEAFRAGAWDFISKPFHLDSFKNCLDKVLERAESVKRNLAYKASLEKKLDNSYLELEKAYRTMENKVKARTAELAIANEQFIKEAEARRKDEKILRTKEELFRGLFNSIPSGAVVCYFDSKTHQFLIHNINKAGEEFLGIKLDNVLDQPVENIFPIGEGDQIKEVLGVVHETGNRLQSPYIEREGNKIICWHENDISKLATGELFILFKDETLRRKAENDLVISRANLEALNKKLKANQNQLIQSEKMASIGQLAAGVAHEINNPVGFITSNLGTLSEYITLFKNLIDLYDELDNNIEGLESEEILRIRESILKLKKEEDIGFVIEDVDTLLSESKDGALRVKEIVQNLKSFARVDEDERKEANINDGIEATLKIVWNELKYKCKVEKDLGKIPNTLCKPGQLNQVFMNLIVNASHAIEGHGTIKIYTRQVGSNVVIKVSDTGKGIEPCHLSKLFDPFFTTKPVGVGTGLGLSISHGIISDHGGTIEVESEVGKGTCFTITIPIKLQGELKNDQ